ncbi:unnamed protein product [Moneuplotes crassus]|uniref:Uncharacterized protein n=1 Tax=Euplotes crassus TaxID=5936 RepID=A0AAD1Y5D0_EUPCR|nr:unnamed protein product [Moneuplotes crassus]
MLFSLLHKQRIIISQESMLKLKNWVIERDTDIFNSHDNQRMIFLFCFIKVCASPLNLVHSVLLFVSKLWPWPRLPVSASIENLLRLGIGILGTAFGNNFFFSIYIY